MSFGNFDDARGWFEQTLAVRETFVAANPANTQWQSDLSDSYTQMGDVAMATGKVDDARTLFDRALAIRKVLVVTDPKNAGWQRDLSESYDRLGDVAGAAGQLDEAQAWFDKALAVTRVLVTADAANASWQRDLCTTLAKLARVARDPTDARRCLGEGLNLYIQRRRSGMFRNDVQFERLGKDLEQVAVRVGFVLKG
jgi:tetratricopeptide (TPR) repeat protein